MQFNKNILCIKRTYYKNNIQVYLLKVVKWKKTTDNPDKIYEDFT